MSGLYFVFISSLWLVYFASWHTRFYLYRYTVKRFSITALVSLILFFGWSSANIGSDRGFQSDLLKFADNLGKRQISLPCVHPVANLRRYHSLLANRETGTMKHFFVIFLCRKFFFSWMLIMSMPISDSIGKDEQRYTRAKNVVKFKNWKNGWMWDSWYNLFYFGCMLRVGHHRRASLLSKFVVHLRRSATSRT